MARLIVSVTRHRGRQTPDAVGAGEEDEMTSTETNAGCGKETHVFCSGDTSVVFHGGVASFVGAETYPSEPLMDWTTFGLSLLVITEAER